jgi:type IV pilus assembly protein PilN
MNIQINLASQPFRRDRPLLIGSAIAGVLLLAVLCLLITLNVLDQRSLASNREDLARLESRLRAIAAEQSKLEAVLREPQNAQVLERSVFLNSLIYRKGISWTRMLADLEQILPHNVRVMSIRPAVNADNQIVLEMNVGAESPEPLRKLIADLESSESFGRAWVSQTLPPTQTEPLFRYRVNVNYAQKL